jgi:hypothetical protein
VSLHEPRTGITGVRRGQARRALEVFLLRDIALRRPIARERWIEASEPHALRKRVAALRGEGVEAYAFDSAGSSGRFRLGSRTGGGNSPFGLALGSRNRSAVCVNIQIRRAVGLSPPTRGLRPSLRSAVLKPARVNDAVGRPEAVTCKVSPVYPVAPCPTRGDRHGSGINRA